LDVQNNVASLLFKLKTNYFHSTDLITEVVDQVTVKREIPEGECLRDQEESTFGDHSACGPKGCFTKSSPTESVGR
jgi:hypothetical protein